MRLLITAAAAVATLLLAAPADAMIQVDRGIAGARIGNSKAEVRAALGKPRRVVKGVNVFGPFTQFRFRGGVRVGFQGNRGVTLVSTRGLGDRTASGVGVGSTEAQVVSGVAGITCATFSGTRICQTGEGLPGQRLTAFFIDGGTVERVDVGIVID
jgi:hypothetical protein